MLKRVQAVANQLEERNCKCHSPPILQLTWNYVEIRIYVALQAETDRFKTRKEFACLCESTLSNAGMLVDGSLLEPLEGVLVQFPLQSVRTMGFQSFELATVAQLTSG